MLHTTMYEDLRNEVIASNGTMTQQQKYNLADKYTQQIINSDSKLWGVSKHLSGYGTWKARIDFANEYHYGVKIKELLTIGLSSIITHDEDKTYSIQDWEEDIFYKLVDMIEEIEEESLNVDTKDISLNFKGAFLEWKDENGDKYIAHLGNDYLDKAEEVKEAFADALSYRMADDPVVSIEARMVALNYPVAIQYELG